ncbi:dsRBD fold-containing protein [Streptomyces sp. YGL11-2]|uniref:dsRBD fold-containing protein n=1 Tax=Streptomyces sp. YGL11-2 TaxID=3414028 RepID=UPI003CECDEF2
MAPQSVRKLTGHGTARWNPEDPNVPEIGDELAAIRAMSDLAAQLARTAYGDLEDARKMLRASPKRDAQHI